MSRWAKVSMVGIGYLLALAAGVVASVLYDRRMAAQPFDTSGGMYAGGQLLAALGAFLAVALVPTLLALWFLRRNGRLWQSIAVASLAFAIFGLLGVLLPLGTRNTSSHPIVIVFSLLGLAQLLGVPF